MKTLIERVIVLFSCFCAISFAQDPITVNRCGGGSDGPQPLLNITGELPQDLTPIPTNGNVKDFFVWEKSNRIVYRNDSDKLIELNLNNINSNNSGETSLGYMLNPLSRVLDKAEKYILADDQPYYLDASEAVPYWYHSYAPDKIREHLFWDESSDGDSLYSLAQDVTTSGETLSFYHWERGQIQPETCNLTTTPDSFFYVGTGHYFPYVFLYKVIQDASNPTAHPKVELWKIEVDGDTPSCAAEKLATIKYDIPGQVVNAYQFTNFRYFALQYTTPDNHKNLMWIKDPILSQQECTVYDFGDRTPMILNKEVPVVAAWAENEGTTLVFPPTGLFPGPDKQATVASSVSSYPMTDANYWISDDGSSLYLMGQPDENSRKLYLTHLQ